MQDIEFIASAVGENVFANQEDSFLNSVCSDVNISKFDDGTVKISVSASVLEEKETKIRELIAVVENQKKALIKLSKSHNELRSEKDRLQQSLEERAENSMLEIRSSKGCTSHERSEYRDENRDGDNDSEVQRLAQQIVQMEKEYKSERDRHLEIINNDRLKNDYVQLEHTFKELKDAKEKLYKELINYRTKIDNQQEEIRMKSL